MDCSVIVGLDARVSWVMCKQEDKLFKDTCRNEASMHEAAGRGSHESRQSPVENGFG